MENPTNKPWILCDIDGTISDNSRREYLIRNAKTTGVEPPWDLYHDASEYDQPIKGMINLVNCLSDAACIAFVTTRNKKWERITRIWLNAHVKFPYELYMREDEDKRRAHEVKHDIYLHYFLEVVPTRIVWLALEDHKPIIQMYRSFGILCLQPKERE